MFGGKHQLAMMPAQVEERIHPRIKIGGTAQAVTGAAMSGDAFFRMVDQGNGRAGLALQNAEVTEQCGDLAGRVFIDGMKADQGIEDEKNRAVKHEGGLEPLLIGEAVQAQRIGGDNANIQILLNFEDDRLQPVKPPELDLVLRSLHEVFPETADGRIY